MITLHKQQQQIHDAIYGASGKRVSVITGGRGTGLTTLLAALAVHEARFRRDAGFFSVAMRDADMIVRFERICPDIAVGFFTFGRYITREGWDAKIFLYHDLHHLRRINHDAIIIDDAQFNNPADMLTLIDTARYNRLVIGGKYQAKTSWKTPLAQLYFNAIVDGAESAEWGRYTLEATLSNRMPEYARRLVDGDFDES